MRQRWTVPFSEAEAMKWPSGEKAIEWTQPPCPSKSFTSSPVDPIPNADRLVH